VLKKFLFFQDEAIQKKINASFGKSVAISGETWKKLVENLSSFALDLKKSFEEKIKFLYSENFKLKENLELMKTEKSKFQSDLMSLEKSLKEIHETELKNYEEKVFF
jgi:hypothetical protein